MLRSEGIFSCRQYGAFLKDRRVTIEAPETEIVDTMRVACDGGEGALGHPRVWLMIDSEKGWVECGYCDKKFLHKDFSDSSKR